MQPAYGDLRSATWQDRSVGVLRDRVREIERMLAIGAYDAQIRQKEREIAVLRQKKAALERELHHLHVALGDRG